MFGVINIIIQLIYCGIGLLATTTAILALALYTCPCESTFNTTIQSYLDFNTKSHWLFRNWQFNQVKFIYLGCCRIAKCTTSYEEIYFIGIFNCWICISKYKL